MAALPYLPQISVAAAAWPFSPQSALALIEAWTTGQTENLNRRLSLDPPLLFWSVCLAWSDFQLELETTTTAAAWLLQHGRPYWASLAPSTTYPTIPSTKLAEWVAQSLMMTEQALRTAPENSPLRQPSGFVPTLLFYTSRWLSQLVEVQGDLRQQLPLKLQWVWQDQHTKAWLDDVATQLARELGIGTAEQENQPPSINLYQRRDELAQEWLTPGVDVSWLSQLAKKLQQGEQLETKFAEQLESEKLEAMGEFAAGVGHEVNNPLATISGRAQLLARDEPHPDRRRELAAIHAQAVRAHEMIADMMLFARPPQPQPQVLDLSHLITKLLSQLQPAAAARNIELQRTGKTTALPIEADPNQVQVALRAILHNSFEAIGNGGQVQVELALSPTGPHQTVSVTISDNGPGIPPDVRRHLFDPYFSGRQAGRGLGLGLSKCWRIMQLHRGRVDVTESRTGGAEFTLHWPALDGTSAERNA